MQVFKLSPDGVDRIISKTRFRSIATMLIALIATSIIILRYSGKEDGSPTDILLTLTIMVGVLIWAYIRGTQKRKKLLGTFIITVNENNVTRQQLDTPLISIAIADIKEILKDKKGNLAIKSNDSSNSIYVPAQIDNFSELEALLHQIKPILEQNPYPITERYPIVVGLITAALLLSVYLSTNKIVVGVTGTLLVGLMAASIYQLSRSKHLDNKTRKRMYFSLLALVSIIAIIIFKLAGIMGY